MALISFFVGDTIINVVRIYEDDGTAIDISGKTIRSIMKIDETEIVGDVDLIDDFTVKATFQTDEMNPGQYKTNVRFTQGEESFSTPITVITLNESVS